MQKKFKKYKNKYKHNGGTFFRKLILVLGSWYYHEFFISSNLEIIVGLLISKFVETFIFSWFSTYSGDWRDHEKPWLFIFRNSKNILGFHSLYSLQ